MFRYFIFIIILSYTFNSCGQQDHLTDDKKKEIIEEIKIMMNQYYNDIKLNGLVEEFKYLDSSKDFSWIPPGYATSISYDSVANLIRSNAAAFKSILNTWDSLVILPESGKLATYTGRIHSRIMDTSGKISNADLLESGTLIKRKDRWKLLNGKTSILPQ